MTVFTPLALPDVILATPRRHGDARGYFCETYVQPLYAANGIACAFVQDNESLSALPGTVRGLHLQAPPFAQAKLVRVLSGAIFDVAVDVRAGSPTHGQWVGARLTADGGEQLFIPHGFAHGFCTLAPDTRVAYKVDAVYDKASERGIVWNDPDIAIDWTFGHGDAILSDKDRILPRLKDFDSPFVYGAA
ncbi:dTDP-4-dehydrorhamnose 3,5-epimerase [Xanthobacter dioxanivorans]|uniref:dTDP-4-dehydrorhamnose 3,5-epimerase n=1 Tax=Xanthobacter dioxanivorans TaxID=2528964 RepID=A0A974PKB0_9HYPH|nr:dTDP-4-dehydrorhamnose 3,5-epimerase [Xanthobacter dioxanivorans]QRG05084.1 dTDP-4-dehydrorhamnose 3,5-epimerase [Xanthobacter dioxanivorans]